MPRNVEAMLPAVASTRAPIATTNATEPGGVRP